MELKFYTIDEAQKLNIVYPDIYFTPEYGRLCEISDTAKWELCMYKDLIYVYLKKIDKDTGKLYLLSPYGYAGIYYQEQDTFKEFVLKFRRVFKEKKYSKEVLRQSPFIEIEISDYNILKSKTIFGIKVSSIDEYLYNVLNSKKRNIIRKAEKNSLCCKFFIHNEKKKYKKKFIKMYNETMIRVESNEYYYFNTQYFDLLFLMDNNILCVVEDEDSNTLAMGIFLIYHDKIHYHLSCNNKKNNCSTDYMIYSVLKQYGLNKLFILGGGLDNNDSLYKFKKKISNIEYLYNIFLYS